MSDNTQNPWRYLDLGFQLAVAVILGVLGGQFLDKKLSTTPLFLILGVLLGAVSGFLNIYRAVYPINKQSSEKNKNEKK